MNDDELGILILERVRAAEPDASIDTARVLRSGRARLLRRRAVRAAVATVAVAAAGALGFTLVAHPETTPRPAPPVTYPGSQMLSNLEQVVADNVPAGVELPEPATLASDGNNDPMPPRYYDKASGFSASYELRKGDRLSLGAVHARGEAEGDPVTFCREMRAGGEAMGCTDTTDAQGNAVLVWVFPVTREHGSSMVHKVGTVSPDRLWFERTVKVIHSETLVGYAVETVRAPSIERAYELWQVPASRLVAMAGDDRLTFAPPPPDPENGCDWTLPSKRGESHC